jgi:hypothetical protein
MQMRWSARIPRPAAFITLRNRVVRPARSDPPRLDVRVHRPLRFTGEPGKRRLSERIVGSSGAVA